MTPTKLTRKQIREGLEQIPVDHLLGKSAARELTAKQKAFALEVAKGSTGAAAYRKAYNTRGKPLTQANSASRLKSRPDINAEIAAYQAAIESEKHRTPAALRALIIKSLVGVIIDEDTPPAVLVQAAKVAGTISEVGLYTERKEVRTISSSDDAKARVMAELRRLMNAQADDAQVIDAAATSLLDELADARPHPSPTNPIEQTESRSGEHTIPPKRSQKLSEPTPHPLDMANPPPIEN
jgi:ethanolamine utilization protein EutP (predicted NTPase)